MLAGLSLPAKPADKLAKKRPVLGRHIYKDALHLYLFCSCCHSRCFVVYAAKVKGIMYYLKAKKNAKKLFYLILLLYDFARVREKNETMQKTIVF